MDYIFGIPTIGIAIFTVIVMGICLLTTAVIALRNRVGFKMALRNVPRRKTQTVLILFGLMLSTMIFSASLATGDTLSYSLSSSAYERLGQVDETIAFVDDAGDEGEISVNNVPIPAAIADELEARFADDTDIESFMPLLTVAAPVVNLDRQLSEPNVVITGVDSNRAEDFGGLQTPAGQPIDVAGLPEDTVVISEDLAARLDASVGDQLALYYNNQQHTLTVGAIAAGSILTGYDPSLENAAELLGIAVPLPWLQQLTGLEGQARFIAVSNRGGVEDGAKHTGSAVSKIEVALSDIQDGQQLGVNPIKRDALDAAELTSSLYTLLFMVFGLFSIAAGMLLIFLIFIMLAAERRSEMGMARAIGMKRRQLVQQFIVEGTVYDLLAALAGVAGGVGLTYALSGVMGALSGDAAEITPHATTTSLIIAYSLGVTVTFFTVILASVRASRLNIVQAIRDLPEARGSRRVKPRWRNLRPVYLLRFLFDVIGYYIGWSPVLVALGVLLTVQGGVGGSLFGFSLGLSLASLGVGLFLRRFLSERLAFTLVAAFMLVYWLAPYGTFDALLPELQGDFEMFFLSGIMMVLFTTMLIMWNADVLLAGLGLVGRVASRWLPAVKTAIAYPMASKGRTGLTIAMFALVMFSLVAMTTISANTVALYSTDEATAGWDIEVVTNPSNPIDDPRAELAAIDNIADIAAIGTLSTISSESSRVRLLDDTDWKRHTINGMDAAYMEHVELSLEARAAGYDTDEEVWAAVMSDPNLALIDRSATEEGGGWVTGSDAFVLSGVLVGERIFPAVPLEIQNRSTGATAVVTVIGVIDARVSSLSGLYVRQEKLAEFDLQADSTRVYVALTDAAAASVNEMAREIEAALFAKGVQAEVIEEQVSAQQEGERTFNTVLQGFAGIGLLVGIAALGVISFRSVVERRQQIGMLRAIGYRKGMVSLSFMLEALVIAVVGVMSGTALAINLCYNVVARSDDLSEIGDFSGFGYVVPWGPILFFVGAAMVAALLMTWLPARHAASVPIAEALRYE